MPTVDTDQVVAMLELGAPSSTIAERLDCTARHVRRIRSEEDVDHSECWAWDTEWERDLIWGPLLDVGISPTRVAWNVGRTPQAVSQWGQQERARTIEQRSADPANWQS